MPNEQKKFLVLFLIPVAVMGGWAETDPTEKKAAEDKLKKSERCILRLKSVLRLEWRSEDAQHKKDQRYHAARRADFSPHQHG